MKHKSTTKLTTSHMLRLREKPPSQILQSDSLSMDWKLLGMMSNELL